MSPDNPFFPALSVRQPRVSYLLAGIQDVENRRRVTHFLGTTLLHASLRFDPQADCTDEQSEALHRTGICPDLDDC